MLLLNKAQIQDKLINPNYKCELNHWTQFWLARYTNRLKKNSHSIFTIHIVFVFVCMLQLWYIFHFFNFCELKFRFPFHSFNSLPVTSHRIKIYIWNKVSLLLVFRRLWAASSIVLLFVLFVHFFLFSSSLHSTGMHLSSLSAGESIILWEIWWSDFFFRLLWKKMKILYNVFMGIVSTASHPHPQITTGVRR